MVVSFGITNNLEILSLLLRYRFVLILLFAKTFNEFSGNSQEFSRILGIISREFSRISETMKGRKKYREFSRNLEDFESFSVVENSRESFHHRTGYQ